MHPWLRVGLRVWLTEAWGTLPHQVPHGQCCDSEEVFACAWGWCVPESWVGNDECDMSLACYCEETPSDCGKHLVPTRCARFQQPCSCIKWLMAWLASCAGPEPVPFLPGTSPRIPNCGEPPVLLPEESCFPIGDVSLPPLPPSFADLFIHRWRHLP